MTDEQRMRLALLELDGWKLVSAPSASEEHARSRITPAFTLERYFRGNRIHEVGEDLDDALERAEWQNARLSQLEDRPTPVHTGPENTTTSQEGERNA